MLVAEAKEAKQFAVVQILKGRDVLDDAKEVTVADDVGLRVGDAAILLGRKSDDGWSWEVVPVDETSLAYFVRLPDARKPWSERLRYCAKFLEHDDAAVADDAYREFGRAPFDEVAAAADAYDFAKVRAWLVEADVPEERKGLYGLMLGLAKTADDAKENVALLRRLATAEASEFRAGFDGVLGGLLWAEGVTALDLIDERFLRNPQAHEGDVRHAQTALRFYQQYGRDIPAERLERSTALLLDRPGTATGALQDLTRRQDWAFVDRCEKLFLASSSDDPTFDRAAIGYLLVCPKPEAAAALRRLRQQAPRRVEEAQRYLALLGVRGGS